jgi:hypothetical protein
LSPARKPTAVKPLRIEPEPEPAKPQFLQKSAPQPVPRRISSRAPKPEIANEPEIIPKRISARAKPVSTKSPASAEPAPEPAVKQKPAEALKAESKREVKAKSERSGKAPNWAHKKVAAVLIAMIVLLSGTAVALVIKIRAQKHSTTSQAERPNETGDVHDSDTPGGVVHQVNLPGKLRLPRLHATSHTNLLLARNGAVASGCANPHFLNDGDAINYDGNSGYAYSDNNNPNEMMTITLREPTEMNHIRFLLWDKDDRSYRYILSTSMDGKTFNPIHDNSKKDSRSWQEIYFPTQKVKAVAIKGVANSANNQLHVVEVEAYNESGSPVMSDGFESPTIGPNNFQYKPKDATWEFIDQAGISGNNSGFTSGAGRAPEGGQVAFVQGNGSFSRSVDLAAGTYLLSFLDAQRVSTQQSFQVVRVSVDSKEIGTFRPAGGNFQPESKNFTVSAGKHTIAFSGVNPNGGDNSVLIDNVVLRSAGPEEEAPKKRTPPHGPAKSGAQLKPGIWAEYFDGLDYYATADDIPDFARAQNGLDLCASTPAPAGQGLHNWPFAGACAAVFSGYIKLDKQGLYTFFLESENGSRLYIDGTLLIDNDGNHGLQETWEQIDLAAGLHRIWLEYYTTGVATGLNVSIKARGEIREFLTSKMLLYDSSETSAPAESQAKSVNLAAQPQVKFLSRDDKRGGTWQKDLGKDGYVIFNKQGGGQHLQKLPPYILALNSYADHCVWQVGQDLRGLEEPAGGGQRLCSCEYSGNEVLIEIRAARNTINRLSLYCLDFDPCGRKQKIQFSDGEKVLNEMEVGDMSKGTWLHYEVAGSLNIKLINLSPTNAVIAGVFWDSDRGVHYRAPKQGQPASDVKPGLVSEYFDGLATYPTDDDVPTFCRLEHTVAFGATPAASGGRELHGWPFAGVSAALFHGCIKIPQDDKYTFVLESDDGSRFYVDGNKLIDNDGAHPMKKVEGSIDLKAGLHRVWIEWYNSAGPFGLNLFMKQKDGKEVPIPAEMLFHE